MTFDYDSAIRVANAVGLAIFLILLGALLMSMGRRVLEYRRRGLTVPVILKRSFGLFAALTILVIEAAIMRMLGIDLTAPGLELERLIFLIQSNVVVDIAFVYYLKTELIDMEDPNKP